MGLRSLNARSKASSPHGYQSTGLCACWRRYGLVSELSRLVYFGLPSGLRCRVSMPPRRIPQGSTLYCRAAEQPIESALTSPSPSFRADSGRARELRLKRGEERRLSGGHLWVFSNEIDTDATPLTA